MGGKGTKNGEYLEREIYLILPVKGEVYVEGDSVFRKRTVNVFLAKIMLLLLINALIGYFTWKDTVHKYQEGIKLTSEQYRLNFEKYKAEQTEEPGPLWFDIMVANMAIFFVFAVYEAIGHGFGALMTGLFNPNRQVPCPPQSEIMKP